MNSFSVSPRNFFIYSFYFLCVVALVLGSKERSGFFTAALELIFIATSALALIQIRGRVDAIALLMGMASAVYIIYSYFVSIMVDGDNVLDFAQAYKSFYYLVLLVPFVSKSIFTENDIVRIFKFSVVCFFVKYLLDRALGIERPILLVENNFELVYLALMFYVFNEIRGELSFKYTFWVGVIFVLSGSRSSMLCFMLAILFSSSKNLSYKFIIYYILVPLGIGLVYYIFASRQGGQFNLEEVDRYKFYLKFLRSTSDWSLWEFLVGARPITPLDDLSCIQLKFYGNLFSYDGSGTCYSVILHSFLLRVIYDHGFIGLIFLYGAVWYSLMGFMLRQRIAILGMLISTALSVSALNNVYVAMSLAILASLNFKDKLFYNVCSANVERKTV
jgi:hypothetical protein